MNVYAWFDKILSISYVGNSVYAYTKAIKNYKGDITLIEMAPTPYIFIISICPVDINKYARFDEIPSMTLKDIKESKRYGRTDGQRENSIPPHKHSLPGV